MNYWNSNITFDAVILFPKYMYANIFTNNAILVLNKKNDDKIPLIYADSMILFISFLYNKPS